MCELGKALQGLGGTLTKAATTLGEMAEKQEEKAFKREEFEFRKQQQADLQAERQAKFTINAFEKMPAIREKFGDETAKKVFGLLADKAGLNTLSPDAQFGNIAQELASGEQGPYKTTGEDLAASLFSFKPQENIPIGERPVPTITSSGVEAVNPKITNQAEEIAKVRDKDVTAKFNSIQDLIDIQSPWGLMTKGPGMVAEQKALPSHEQVRNQTLEQLLGRSSQNTPSAPTKPAALAKPGIEQDPRFLQLLKQGYTREQIMQAIGQ